MLLSVCMITYNHSQFIENAIIGVLSQVVNFDFELIIADDCSPDNTKEIVTNIINNHPNGKIIKYTKQQNNLGPAKNFIWTLNNTKGKYVALCEGDDYWTDELKLQKQVDFLESNKEFSMCFHSVDILNYNKLPNYEYPIPTKDVLNFKEILLRHYIPTCSLVFVKERLPMPLPEWLKKANMCDIPIELFLADNGKTKFINSNMAVYRLNSNSITHNKDHIKKGRASFDYLYKNLRLHFKYKYYILFTFLILKNKLGYIKDFIGLNPLLKT